MIRCLLLFVVRALHTIAQVVVVHSPNRTPNWIKKKVFQQKAEYNVEMVHVIRIKWAWRGLVCCFRRTQLSISLSLCECKWVCLDVPRAKLFALANEFKLYQTIDWRCILMNIFGEFSWTLKRRWTWHPFVNIPYTSFVITACLFNLRVKLSH